MAFIFILVGCENVNISVNNNSVASLNNQASNSNQAILNQNVNTDTISQSVAQNTNQPVIFSNKELANTDFYAVTRVVDGDTIDVNINGIIKRVRLIGINTPEVVDPRKPVECFGIEASNKAKEVLTGKSVILEKDPSQGDVDKYGRLLRYIWLTDGTNFNKLMIEQGYAYEYTYNLPYKYQQEFKEAQKYAQENKLGLWQDNICQTITEPISTSNTTTNQNINAVPSGSCVIKGNINSSGEKIYHLPGCGSYDSTVITESRGERWFCTEEEAIAAGWRKAKNCP